MFVFIPLIAFGFKARGTDNRVSVEGLKKSIIMDNSIWTHNNNDSYDFRYYGQISRGSKCAKILYRF